MNKRNVVAIDCEVGTFNYELLSLTQFSAVSGDSHINLLINPFSIKGRVFEVLDFNLRRSGTEIITLKERDNHDESIKSLYDFMTSQYNKGGKITLLGHNLMNHDLKIIKREFDLLGLEYSDMFVEDDKHIDTMLQAWKLRDLELLSLQDYKLGTLCEWFGIPMKRWHDSLSDCHSALSLYREMGELESRNNPLTSTQIKDLRVGTTLYYGRYWAVDKSCTPMIEYIGKNSIKKITPNGNFRLTDGKLYTPEQLLKTEKFYLSEVSLKAKLKKEKMIEQIEKILFDVYSEVLIHPPL